MGDVPPAEPAASAPTPAPASEPDPEQPAPSPPRLPPPPRYYEVVAPIFKRRSRLIFAACTAASLLVCGGFAWLIVAYVMQGGTEGPFPYGAFTFLAIFLPLLFCIVCRGGLDMYLREANRINRFILEDYTRQLEELTSGRFGAWGEPSDAEQAAAAAAEPFADGDSAMYTLPRYTPIAPPNEVVVIIDRPPPVYTDTHYLTADEIAELSAFL